MRHLKGMRFGLPFIKRIGVLKDRQAHRIRWNVHDGLELHYVLKGLCTWEIAGRDDPLSVPGGTFIAIPANVRHRPTGENAAPSDRLGVIYEAAPSVPAEGVSFRPEDLVRLFGVLEAHSLSVHGMPSRLLHVLKEVKDAAINFKTPEEGLRLRILSELLIVETARVLEAGDTILPRNGSVVPQICKWIGNHLDACFSMDKLVRISGYGRSRFFSLFFEETGMSPNDYVVRMRVERAKKLLLESALPIMAIALSCGFKSASTFSSTFTKFIGVSPRTFRRWKVASRKILP